MFFFCFSFPRRSSGRRLDSVTCFHAIIFCSFSPSICSAWCSYKVVSHSHQIYFVLRSTVFNYFRSVRVKLFDCSKLSLFVLFFRGRISSNWFVPHGSRHSFNAWLRLLYLVFLLPAPLRCWFDGCCCRHTCREWKKKYWHKIDAKNIQFSRQCLPFDVF